MDPKNKSLADQRAEQGAIVDDPLADQDADFAAEHSASTTSPPNAPADAPGGEAEGYSPQTRVRGSRWRRG